MPAILRPISIYRAIAVSTSGHTSTSDNTPHRSVHRTAAPGGQNAARNEERRGAEADRWSDAVHGGVTAGGQADLDHVTRTHPATLHDDGHDTATTHRATVDAFDQLTA